MSVEVSAGRLEVGAEAEAEVVSAGVVEWEVWEVWVDQALAALEVAEVEEAASVVVVSEVEGCLCSL